MLYGVRAVAFIVQHLLVGCFNEEICLLESLLTESFLERFSVPQLIYCRTNGKLQYFLMLANCDLSILSNNVDN